jgi:hypothetical protein
MRQLDSDGVPPPAVKIRFIPFTVKKKKKKKRHLGPWPLYCTHRRFGMTKRPYFFLLALSFTIPFLPFFDLLSSS